MIGIGMKISSFIMVISLTMQGVIGRASFFACFGN